jgi:hypothetical protein
MKRFAADFFYWTCSWLLLARLDPLAEWMRSWLLADDDPVAAIGRRAFSPAPRSLSAK